MKNYKIVFIIVLALLILLVVTLFYNKNINKEAESFNKNTLGKIYGLNTKYKDLDNYEKSLVEKLIITNIDLVKELKENYNNLDVYKDALHLLSYNKSVAVFCLPTGKIGCYTEFYSTDTFKKMDNINQFIFGNEVISGNYIIIVYENNIFYFEKNMTDFNLLENSMLLDKKETYIRQGGMVDDYEFFLDEKTNKLKVSIFKNENKEDQPNAKLREVEFVLP